VTGAVDAMLGGWDHKATLAAMRLAPGLEDSRALDWFDWKGRGRVPNRGLEGLRGLGAPPALLERLAGIGEGRPGARGARGGAGGGVALGRREWAERVGGWARSRLLEEALDEAAEALDGRAAMGLGSYWRAVKAVLRLQPLREPDARRNVVNVLSAHEARQWVL